MKKIPKNQITIFVIVITEIFIAMVCIVFAIGVGVNSVGAEEILFQCNYPRFYFKSILNHSGYDFSRRFVIDVERSTYQSGEYVYRIIDVAILIHLDKKYIKNFDYGDGTIFKLENYQIDKNDFKSKAEFTCYRNGKAEVAGWIEGKCVKVGQCSDKNTSRCLE
jgi:hypothetical protein